jgi:hypothetical protein
MPQTARPCSSETLTITSLAFASPRDAPRLHAITFAQGVPETNHLAMQESAARPGSMTKVQSHTPLPSHETHNTTSSRSLGLASSPEKPTSIRAATPRQGPPSKAAAPAARTFFDPWNSSSTGHQRAENRLSGSTSWRVSRNLKLSAQYKGGLAGGEKRVADTVGAGSTDFGKDGRKPNGGWEKGAKGLRTGGQKSLVDIWGATKASKSLQEKDTASAHADPHEDVVSQHADEHTDQDEGTFTLHPYFHYCMKEDTDET